MWPWEHLAVGYLLYSLVRHLGFKRSPSDGGTLLLALGTQFPDLIDKPLAWGLGVLPSGLSLGHSLLFAVPFIAAVSLLWWQRGEAEYGLAFGIGYLAHLPADAIYPMLYGGQPSFGFLLWPLVPARGGTTLGLFEQSLRFFTEFVSYLGTPKGAGYVALEIGLLLAAFGLWISDGVPGFRTLRRLARWRATN